MTPPGSRAASSTVVPTLVVFFCALSFLLLFKATELSDNSVGYAAGSRDMIWFYPPHLLYSASVHFAYLLLSRLISCDVVYAGQLLSALWGAVAVAATFTLLRRLLCSRPVALFGAAWLLVAHGFWVYATQLEVYVPVVACQALVATALSWNERAPGPLRVALVVSFWAIGTLFHTANFIFFIPVTVYCAVRWGGRGLLSAGLICALAGTLVLATFVIVFLATEVAPFGVRAVLDWILDITAKPMTNWGTFYRFGARLLEGLAVQSRALVVMPNLRAATLHMILGSTACALILAWNLLQIARRAPLSAERAFFVVWALLYFFFFTWWSPVHKFYIPSSFALICLGSFALADVLRLPALAANGRRLLGAGAGALLAGTFATGLYYSVLPLRHSRGPDYQEAEALNQIAPPECQIDGEGQHVVNLDFFFARRGGLELRPIYTAWYTGTPWPPPGQDCVLIRLGFIWRDHFIYRTERYMGAERWPEFLGWYLAVRSEDGGITHDALRVLTPGSGQPHLLVDRRRRARAASVAALIESLEPYAAARREQWGEYWWKIGITRWTIDKRWRGFIFGYAALTELLS